MKEVCIQCGEELTSTAMVDSTEAVGRIIVYICEYPGCPCYGLYQRGEEVE